MKFTRNAKIFRGQLDAAPFAGVCFLFVIFLLLATLVYTPGVTIHLPEATNLPGTDRPTLAVAVGASGQFYFENQLIQEAQLKSRLKAAVQDSTEPLTLVVQADIAVTNGTQSRLLMLAREVGIKEVVLATRPRAFVSPPGGAAQP